MISARAKVYSLFFLVCFSLFVPKGEIAGVWVGLDDLLVLSYALYFFCTRLGSGRFLRTDLPVLPLIAFVFLFIVVGLIQAQVILGEVRLPTELWQFLKRALCFAFAAEVFFRVDESTRIVLFRILLISAISYLLFGVLQYYLGGPLIDLYARTEGQQRLALNLFAKRLFGVSGFSTSWGGVCFVAFIIVVTLTSVSSVVKSAFFQSGVIAFCFFLFVFNAFFSGSRAVFLAGAFGIFLYLFLRATDFDLYFFGKLVLGIVGFAVVASYFASNFVDQIDFVLFRFVVLQDTGGGERAEQIEQGLHLINGGVPFFLGVSNSVQRVFGVSHGIEVEPVNLFVSYGLVGVAFIYISWFSIVVGLYRVERSLSGASFLGCFVVVGFSFLFSFGYFVFQELIVGAYLWIFLGSIYGAAFNSSRARPALAA